MFNNVGAENVTIKDSLGGTLATVVPGSAWQIYLTDNSTAAGVWQSFQYGASISVANAAALVGNGLINIGLTLALNLAVTDVSTTPLVLGASSRARIFKWTSGVGAVSVPDASTLGDGWFAILRNAGSGNWVVTPTAGTIDGAASVTIAPAASLIVVSDGTNYITLLGGSSGGGGSSFNLLSVDVAGAGDYTISGAQLGQVGYKLTGVLSGNRNFIVPNTVAQYWIDNQTTGAFTLTVKTAAGTGIVVPQGVRNILYSDGTNVVGADSGTVTFPVAIAQGGTNATTIGGAQTNLQVPPTSRLVSAGAGLSGGGSLAADRTLAVDIFGLESLADPGADRILFFDDSAGLFEFLALLGGLAIVGTDLTMTAPPRASATWANGEVTTQAATLNTSDMATGYMFGVYNDSGANITITQGAGVTLRQSGTTNTGSRVIPPRGFAVIWCKSGTEAVISGDTA